MGWPRVKAKAVWACEWKSKKKKALELGRGEENMQNKGLVETLIVTWLEGFLDFGERKLGNGCGCFLQYLKSFRSTVTALCLLV